MLVLFEDHWGCRHLADDQDPEAGLALLDQAQEEIEAMVEEIQDPVGATYAWNVDVDLLSRTHEALLSKNGELAWKILKHYGSSEASDEGFSCQTTELYVYGKINVDASPYQPLRVGL